MSIDYSIVGERLKRARLEKKLTQEDLAEQAEVSTALIGNLESEKISQGISVYSLYKISTILNTPIEKFFSER